MINPQHKEWFIKCLMDVLIMTEREDIMITNPSASMQQEHDEVFKKDGKVERVPIGPQTWNIQFTTEKIKPRKKMGEFTFELGEDVEDKVSGSKGMVTARAQYHLGMNRYGITSESKKGAIPLVEWFDEPRLKHFTKA